jgi:hypothetical protein
VCFVSFLVTQAATQPHRYVSVAIACASLVQENGIMQRISEAEFQLEFWKKTGSFENL